MTQIKGLEKLDPETTKALVKAGYKSMKSIAIAIPADIIGDTGLSESVVEEIIAKSISNVSFPPLSAAELLKIEQNKGKLTTGSNSLDDLLAGGPWTGEITEISGVFSTGKSQLCFQLAVTAQLDRGSGGLEGKVFFVDSEGTFSATRIGEMAIALDLDPHEILKNIFVARVLDSQQQTRVIQKISEIAESENIRLVIVDSIAAHFRSDYIGSDKLAERQQRIMQYASALTNLAYVHDIAVVVTNQMVQKLDKLSGGSQLQPALGEAWSHRPQTRIVLRKPPGNARIARLTDSPRRPEGEEVFYITNNGIRDNPRG
ncbi:MAG: DNA repair and recombination protein RadA [Candidatus Heimdallarchaeota archaeon]|nr:DNA repair and recombination protein RadA [Candidatus Heimdallarchaeota archaeon]